MRSTPPLLLLAALAAGCSSGTSEPVRQREVSRGLDRAEASVGRVDPGWKERAPVALVDGRAVGWEEIRPRLAELAGGEVIEELALERALEAACERDGVRVGTAEIEAERARIVDAMSAGAGLAVDANEAARLVERVRRERGLGPERFRSLLRRNAMLRALVADEVVIEPEAIERMRERVYGPDYPCRVIVTSSAADAARAIRRVRGGEPFGAVAAELSIDQSAARGGIIEPINAADASWPLAVRTTAESLDVGQVSDPIVVDGGYAVLWLERAPARKATPSAASVRSELERLVRLDRERVLMQELAETLLEDAEIRTLDPSLDWARRSD